MKGIQIAMETEISSLAGKVLAGERIGLTLLLFHEDGYRVLNTPDASGMVIAQSYLGSQDASAYGILFEADFSSDTVKPESCLMMAVVKREGLARVERLPIIRDEKGNLSFDDRKTVFLDEEFLKLFDPLDTSKYRTDLLAELVDEVLKVSKHPYNDFIVARG